MDDFTREVSRLFTTPLSRATLFEMSKRLQLEFKPKLRVGTANMLPSFTHSMPTGFERGTFLSLDVGGSTLRVAIVELIGRYTNSKNKSPMEITALQSWKINDEVKQRKGREFFDWMAERIDDMLAKNAPELARDPRCPLDVGLAWSFPIEQTSTRTGTLLSMGKGFQAHAGLLGSDLSSLIETSCSSRKLSVRVEAIVNDSAATLLSRAYLDPTTRMALILGTGVNAAIYLPVSSLGRPKFGRRPSAWIRAAQHVVVNTEMSMFGKYVFPTTRWDEYLNANHVMPDFQPFEHLVSGRYLGEIFRLVLVEGVQTAGLFGGDMPDGLTKAYGLDTGVMAAVEGDSSADLAQARAALTGALGFAHPPTLADLFAAKHIAQCISRRAAAYLAVGVHALWALRKEAEAELAASESDSSSGRTSPVNGAPYTNGTVNGNGNVDSDVDGANENDNDDNDDETGFISIGCNGSVFEKYPRFAETAQGYVDDLTIGHAEPEQQRLVLVRAVESSLFGAAVAVSVGAEPDTVQVTLNGRVGAAAGRIVV